MTQEQTTPPTAPADWAIQAAIERSGIHWSLEGVRHAVANRIEGNLSRTVIELARMIERHETPPVDPDARLVADIINTFEGTFWAEQDVALKLQHKESFARALAVYQSRKGETK